jgi:tetratricopeptide (TPR) repeat protein
MSFTGNVNILKKLCQNHIVVWAAGNHGCVLPKELKDAIAEDEYLQKYLFIVSNVTADLSTNEMASVLSESSCYFSEQGVPDALTESVGICAPGTRMFSTIPEYTIKRFGMVSGTSFAAPVVTGAIAKLMSDFPDLSITEIADLVRAGANKQGVFADRGKYGEGFLDLQKTYRLAKMYVLNKEKGIPAALKDLNNIFYKTKDVPAEDNVLYEDPMYGNDSQILDPMQALKEAGDAATPQHFRDVGYKFKKEKAYEDAAQYYILALEKAGEEAEIYDFLDVFKALNKIGKPDEANNYMKLAIAKAEKDENDDNFSEIAGAFYKTGHYNESIFYAKKTLEKAGDNAMYYSYIQVAQALTKLGQHDESENFIALAIERADATGSTQYALQSIVNFLTKTGQTEQAEKYRELAKKLGS